MNIVILCRPHPAPTQHYVREFDEVEERLGLLWVRDFPEDIVMAVYE